MKLILFSVYDLKARSYGNPTVYPNSEVAKRDFSLLVNNNPMMRSNPDDFSFVQVGTFDCLSGHLDNSLEVEILAKDVLIND